MESIIFDIETRQFLYGMRPCTMCGHRDGDHPHDAIPAGVAVVFPDVACVKCKGTGRRGNGRCRECKRWNESWRADRRPIGMVPDYKRPMPGGPCGSCDGTGEVLATPTDTLPAETLADVLTVCPVRMYPANRELSWSEAHLGMLRGIGTLWSCTDYGTAWNAYVADPDAALATIAAKVTTDRVQACKLTDETGLVVDHIGILLARDGYTVVAVPARSDDAPVAVDAGQ